MTQDEIIEMARQAGLANWHKDLKKWQLEQGTDAFAKLVEERTAAKEREACAQTCENLPIPDQYSDSEGSMWDVAAIECAEAIRARGEA
jgi:hypothetical protein